MEVMDKLLELDEKHNDILQQLADLDDRIAKTLQEWSGLQTEKTISFQNKKNF